MYHNNLFVILTQHRALTVHRISNRGDGRGDQKITKETELKKIFCVTYCPEDRRGPRVEALPNAPELPPWSCTAAMLLCVVVPELLLSAFLL
jgi:hypothetical protein